MGVVVFERQLERPPLKAFLRALKYAWPYRYRILFSWFCAVLVAGLYFASFTTVIPLVGFLLGGQATAEVHTRQVENPAQPGQLIPQPTVIIPYGYTVRSVAQGEMVLLDTEAREVTVPSGYGTAPGGLEGLVEGTRGKWYYPHLRREIGRAHV